MFLRRHLRLEFGCSSNPLGDHEFASNPWELQWQEQWTCQMENCIELLT
jgi:hypothetical protein